MRNDSRSRRRSAGDGHPGATVVGVTAGVEVPVAPGPAVLVLVGFGRTVVVGGAGVDVALGTAVGVVAGSVVDVVRSVGLVASVAAGARSVEGGVLAADGVRTSR